MKDVISLEGVCEKESWWDGHSWVNQVGNYIVDFNKQLKKQGYKIVKIRKDK